MLYAKDQGITDAFFLSKIKKSLDSKSYNARQRLFRDACMAAERWTRDGVSAHACAFFAVKAIRWRDNLAPDAVAMLQAFLHGKAGIADLGKLRDRISLDLIRAKNAPRRLTSYYHTSEECRTRLMQPTQKAVRLISGVGRSHLT
jgi:hypothetical protein